MECSLEKKSLSGTKPLQTPVKQCLESHELVKYMSKLPVFLERAEATPQEKLLSVGVLDWGRLEKWQHSHNRVPVKTGFPSETDALLAPLRDESSAGPSKVHDPSSACRIKHRSSRHSNGMSHSVEEIVKEDREIKCTKKKKPKDRKCFTVPDEQLGPNTDAQGLDGCKRKDLKGKVCQKNGTLSNGLNPEAGLKMQVKSKVDSDRRRKSEKNLHQRNRNDHDGELVRKQQREAKTCKRSSTRQVRVVHGIEIDYCTQHACPLPCKAGGCLEKSKLDSTDADQNKVSIEISQCVPLSTTARNISSRGKITEDRASSLLSVKHCMDEPAQRQDSKSHNKVASENGRSISPFQRLSFSMGKASKTNSEGVAVPTTQLDSMVNSTKIDSQNVSLLSDVDGSDCNKPSEKDTTTTSHLRRLLEPLLKPRANHSSSSVEGTRGQGVQRIKLGITGCKTVNVNDSAHEKKVASSMVRAVLRVTVKNNQPLFTFAVNKETDIIAATQKKMGNSEEGECTSVYTFFSIKDHKRNSGWLNQRGRGQTHGIISNVVAQMRVSSSLPSGSIREFVLFSVELDQESTENSDLQLKNELAAIIVKMPRWFHRRASLYTVQDHNALDEELEDHTKDRFFDQDISATVILQSGVHSMPQKGGPSSLIQRWRTGGSCDCGGWDMGCNLRILTNQHNFSYKKSTTSNSPPSSNRFELFFLGEQAEEHPYLSFKPIKEGIYSIVYNASLSQLQAFSICIALAESRKMSEIILEHKSSCDEHNARAETMLFRDQNALHDGNAVGYQPPISPVGRV